MNEVYIGEIIRQRRRELHLTQEQLCEGICEPSNISRFENGTQTPSRTRLNALLQRLGLPEEKYYALQSKNELEVNALREEIVSLHVQYRHTLEPERSEIWAQATKLLRNLENIAEETDHITQQFILRSKVLLGNEDGPYDFERQLDMLLKAIHLTAHNFELDKINDGLYFFEEIKIINQIALLYSRNEQHEKAEHIFRQLLEYIQTHYQNIRQTGGYLPMIAHNYARELTLCKRYEESVKFSEVGWRSCVKYGSYGTLPGFLHNMALCYHYLRNDAKCKDFCCQAYYVYKAIGNQNGIARIRGDAEDVFHIKLPD